MSTDDRPPPRLAVRFRDSRIDFRDYPYAPATVHPDGSVVVAAIRDVDPTAAPLEVRLHTGETLFVRGAQHDELRTFCERNDLPLRRRPDLWDALLQPFVDTEFTPDLAESTAALLERFGISSDDATAIRARFADAMVAYNFGTGLWDWVHLGLMDLLEALSGPFAGAHLLRTDEFTEVYWWAMALADRSAGASEPLREQG